MPQRRDLEIGNLLTKPGPQVVKCEPSACNMMSRVINERWKADWLCLQLFLTERNKEDTSKLKRRVMPEDGKIARTKQEP